MTKRRLNRDKTMKRKKLPPSQDKNLAKKNRMNPSSSSGDGDDVEFSASVQSSLRNKEVTVDSLKVSFSDKNFHPVNDVCHQDM